MAIIMRKVLEPHPIKLGPYVYHMGYSQNKGPLLVIDYITAPNI